MLAVSKVAMKGKWLQGWTKNIWVNIISMKSAFGSRNLWKIKWHKIIIILEKRYGLGRRSIRRCMISRVKVRTLTLDKSIINIDLRTERRNQWKAVLPILNGEGWYLLQHIWNTIIRSMNYILKKTARENNRQGW